MTMEPIAGPIRRVLEATTLRRLAVKYDDWADTERRSESYFRTTGQNSEADRAAGRAAGCTRCAKEARFVADQINPPEKPDAG